LSNIDDFNPIAGLAVLWTREQLTQENMEWVRNLPQGPISPMEGVQCVHGSPRDEDEYVLMRREAHSILGRNRAPLTFFGHTHVQGGFWRDDANEKDGIIQMEYPSQAGKQQFSIRLSPTATYLINPGSVGQPRDGDPRAAFATYQPDEKTITFHRVPYDIKRAQDKIFAAGLPERLGIRLEEGR
jgi:diadenosine tetraphosphatase ApaH/serine/threonine PP2A family protein phosphatase